MPATEIRPRGRPRSFDAEAGVALALDLFARQGYDAVGVAQLCARLAIRPPSLYAAYGSKRALFDRAVARYADRTGPVYAAAIAAATSPADLRARVLTVAVDLYTSDASGCLVLSTLTATADVDLQAALAAILNGRRAAMTARLRALGACDADTQSDAITVAMMGLSAAARAGMDRPTLRRILDSLG